MAKHTKGPWIAIHGHDKNYVEPLNETSRGDYVAYCSGQGDIGIEEAAANADLIAAAPDLLEALDAMQRVWRVVYVEGLGRQIMVGDAIEKARAAMSKARGKQ